MSKEFPLKVIFVDFDGTLVDSLSALWSCFQAFLKHYHIEATKEQFNLLIGPSLKEIVRFLKEKYALQESLETLLAEYVALVSKKYTDEVECFPNALKVLRKAKKQGIKLVLVTSAPKKLIDQFFEKNGINDLFDLCITPLGNEPTKPNPAIYRRALKESGMEAKQAIAIEDSENGIKSAAAAGIPVIKFEGNWENLDLFT